MHANQSLPFDDSLKQEFSFFVDESDALFVQGTEGLEPATRDTESGPVQMLFAEIFADAKTANLFNSVLVQVRQGRSILSFPYRCDNTTHCLFFRVQIAATRDELVEFKNQMIASDPRPSGVTWNRKIIPAFTSDSSDQGAHTNNGAVVYETCSLCCRVSFEDTWYEYQELIDQEHWSLRPNSEEETRVMSCKSTLCATCESAVNQRLSDAIRYRMVA